MQAGLCAQCLGKALLDRVQGRPDELGTALLAEESLRRGGQDPFRGHKKASVCKGGEGAG